MQDARLNELARILVHHSTRLQSGDRLLIEVIDGGSPLARAIVEEAYRVGAEPYLTVKDHGLLGALLRGASPSQVEAIGRWEAARMQAMQAYVGIRGWHNPAEWADVPAAQTALYQKYWWKPVHTDLRIRRTRWCVVRYPNAAMAFAANMSREAFTDFYFKVCCLDYRRMAAAMQALKERMNRTDEVRITGPGTDLTFSIAGIPAVVCAGEHNIPDGEVFTAPVRDSVDGVVTFNTPSVHGGFTYENVRLTFRAGRVVDVGGNDPPRIDQVLDTDEAARYVGEFSLGVNPHILRPMKDTLFDEKIQGSFHLTPGGAYEEADNGNRSAVHWDLVCIQRPEYGGGEIYFDGELIPQAGRFIPSDLATLNPEHLV